MNDLPEVEFAKHGLEEKQKELARSSEQSDVDSVRASFNWTDSEGDVHLFPLLNVYVD